MVVFHMQAPSNRILGGYSDSPISRAGLSRKFDKGASPSNDAPPCETCLGDMGFISSKRYTSIQSPESLQSQFPREDETRDQARLTMEALPAEEWRAVGWDQVLMAWSSHILQEMSPGMPGQHSDDFSMKALQRQLDSNYTSEL